MSIRILIADDHKVVAEGLRFLVERESDMKVIACVENGREAVRASIDSNPDIVLMDIAMPELNGTEAAQLISKRCAEIKIIMLSMYSDPVHVYRALQAGASGYVLKKAVAKDVVDAIRTVRAGGRYLSKPLAEQLIDNLIVGKNEDPVERLSSRERQVLQLLAEGISVVDIARKLSLSPKTVETYRSRMMEKLDIRDLAGLIKFAIQQGLSTLE
jgi:DNA-binding NarL/FixJ family response regulator